MPSIHDIDYLNNRPCQINEVLLELNDEINRRKSSSGQNILSGIETGFTDLDRLMTGMRPGSLIVVASRPAMGKFIFALNMASHVALEAKLPVLVFSMEASSVSVASRLISQVGTIEMKKLRTGDLDETDQRHFVAAQEKIKDAQLFISESPSLTVEEIIAKTREVMTQHGRLGLVVIDYLQLIDPIALGDGNPEDYLEVMASLKALAREIDTPIILVSLLSDRLEKRRNMRPRMSDLPDRAIGQYSDLLMFMYRDERYNPESSAKHVAEISIGRHRYGAVGMFLLGTLRLKYCEFSN